MDEGDFGWALAKMRDGYKVRRRTWPAGSWLSLAPAELMMPYNYAFLDHTNAAVHNMAVYVLLAQDWELHLD